MKKLLKQAYELLPFKKQLFKIVRLFKPPRSLYQHLHFKGVITVPVEDSYFRINHLGYELENDLFWGGLNKWESMSLNLWIRLSRQSKTILDVGANSGVYSLCAAAVNPDAKVFAFEPLPAVNKVLRSNLALNPYDIKPSDVAISNTNGYTSFYANSEVYSYTASLNPNHQAATNTLEIIVQAKTLDNFVEENAIAPDLVKIDVERHEPEVIEGFLKSINKYMPTMLIEVIDEDVAARLDSLLKHTSYLYFTVNDATRTVTPTTGLKMSDDFNILVCKQEVAKKLGLTT